MVEDQAGRGGVCIEPAVRTDDAAFGRAGLAPDVDDLALRIREVGREHDVTILPNPPLARVLFETVEVDDVVPAEHYKAVAEIISYVFRLKGKLK